jgi:hypothetical protein
LVFLSQSAAHGGQPCPQFRAYALAHKGKATADIDYNPNDPAEAYSDPSIHSRLSDYTDMAREIYGPEYDPSSHDFDGDIVMRVGGGKKHGRYWMGDSVIDSASTHTLAEIRAQSTSQRPTIRPRPSVAQGRVNVLEVSFVCFIFHSSEHIVVYLDCNIVVAFVRPSWKKRGGNGRRWRRG